MLFPHFVVFYSGDVAAVAVAGLGGHSSHLAAANTGHQRLLRG